MRELKEGMILTSEERDAVILTTKHINGWYVRDCEYVDDEYIPAGREYLLTFEELEKHFN